MTNARAVEQSRLNRGTFIWYSRIPFLVAVAIGGVGMGLMKVFVAPQVDYGQVWVTLFACAVILGYCGLVAATPILRIRDDQLADNCYYLGFLFTLFSLSFALWEYSATKHIEVIVSNFGIALASTILGVVLRVFINQARRDILETERDARIELSEAVVRLRVEVDDAVLALGSFCRNARQAAEEQIRATAEESNKALEEGVKRVGEASTEVLGRIEEAFREFRDHASTLNQSSAETVKAIRFLLTRIEKIDAPSDLVSKRLEPALAAADTVAQRLSARLEADEAMLSQFAARSQEIQDSLAAAAAKAADVSGLNANAAAASKATTDRLAEVTESANALIEEQKKMTGALRNHNETLTEEVNRARRVLSETSGALADLAETITERLQ